LCLAKLDMTMPNLLERNIGCCGWMFKSILG